MEEPLDGIVLAGGDSRRLGTDKALLRFGGRPLLAIVVERLAGVCREVVVAYGDAAREASSPLPARIVADAFPGQGPLAGLEAGLRAISGDFALVVACDMPFLNPGLLAYMAGLPRRYQALVPRVRGRWHPLHAIYARSSLPIIQHLLTRGRNSLKGLLAQLDVCPLSEEELGRFDPLRLSLFNLNGPRDLARARILWRRWGGKVA